MCVLAGLAWTVLLMVTAEVLRGEFAVQGQSSSKLGSFVRERYGRFIGFELFRIAQAYAWVGTGLAVLATLVWQGWDRLRGRAQPGFVGRLARVWLLAGVFWAAALVYGLARSPQLYSPWFYEQGGLLRALQTRLGAAGARTVGLVLAGLALPPLALALVGLWGRARRWPRRARFGVLAVAAAALVLAGTHAARWPHRKAAYAGGPPRRPNVLVLAADSLRPDHMSSYGYRRPTPHMDRVAGRGVRFEQAFVSLPRTFPSWVTLLTGTFPTTHGVMHMFPTRRERQLPHPALPQRLREQGYATGVVGDYAADIFARIDLGFAERDVPTLNMLQLVGTRVLEEHRFLLPFLDTPLGRAFFPVLGGFANDADPQLVADRALGMMDRLAARGPFFEVVFFSTTHFPYAAPDPYYRRYTAPDYDGPDRFAKRDFVERGAPDAAAREQLVALYDGAVAAVDDAVGRLLEGLEARGLDRDTIVVLLADHGEDLYEPGRRGGHGDSLAGDAATRIPLVIADPRAPTEAGRVEKALVRDVDLVPTLAARLGLEAPAWQEGIDLGPLMRGRAPDPGLRSYQETDVWFLEAAAPADRIPYPDIVDLLEVDRGGGHQMVLKEEFQDLVIAAKHRAVRTDRWKLILAPTRAGTLAPTLFDLKADPAQRLDVARLHPDVVGELTKDLRAHVCRGRAVQCSRELVLAREPDAARAP